MPKTRNLTFTSAALVAAALGCGDGAICPSEVLVTISAPFNGANLTNADDRDLDREGVQFNVPVRSNLPPGSQVELEIEVVGGGGETVVASATTDDDGNATFEDVTFPYGEVRVRALSAEDDCGDSADGITVNVIEATALPPPVSGILLTAITRNTVDATWDAPLDTVSGYIVKISDDPLTENNFNITGTELTPPNGDDATPATTATLLKPGTPYYVGVASLDQNGTRSVVVIGGPVVPDFTALDYLQPGGGVKDDQFGYKVAGGDLNNDGNQDVVMAANGFDGAVYVFFGDGTTIPATPSVTISGANDELLGSGIAVLDWNGDGADDLAVGAPFAVPCPAFCDGGVFIYHGGAGFTGSLDTGDADVTVNVSGTSLVFDQAGIGNDLAAARFDNDARDDLIIGAYGANAGVGAVVVLYGGTTDTTISLDETIPGPMGTTRGFYFEEPGFYNGSSFALYANRIFNLGRTEGSSDDTDDLGVAYFDNNSAVVLRGRAQPGAAGLALATFAGGSDLEIQLPSADFMGGGDGKVQMGASMTTISDQNADGGRDIVIGAWREGNDAGQVFIVDGDAVGTKLTSDGAFVLADLTSTTTSVLFGSEVAVADIDGDGADDLLVGGVDPQGASHALFIWYADNIPSGPASALGADQTRVGPATFIGDVPPNNERPTTLSFVGDIDGDGLTDLCWADWNGEDGGTPENQGVVQFLR